MVYSVSGSLVWPRSFFFGKQRFNLNPGAVQIFAEKILPASSAVMPGMTPSGWRFFYSKSNAEFGKAGKGFNRQSMR
jgi:hypothetical protein